MLDTLRLAVGNSLLSDWIVRNGHRLKDREVALAKFGQYFHPTNLGNITAAGVRDSPQSSVAAGSLMSERA